jgi:eukaryotic-like serine/threonine-protein kinase
VIEYSTRREIARTAHYIVHEAIRNRDGKAVAMKTLIQADNVGIKGRFKNEVRLLARLDHPNIVRVLDQNLDARQPWVTTPLYQSDLREFLRSALSVQFEERAAIFESVLSAVEYSHAQGVIHRDIKPANVLLNGATDVVLIDFNISISTTCDMTRHTKVGDALGTPFYLAPEQLHAPGTADARADVFSLGVLLFELLGGRVGSSAQDLDPIPERFRALIVRAMAPKAADRYTSVSEMKRVWRLLRDGSARQSEANEVNQLASQSALTIQECSRLSALLAAYADDRDLLDRFFVSADSSTIYTLANAGEMDFLVAVRAWLKFVGSQSWPFSYTDKIAERCRLLHNAATGQVLRAYLITAVVSLGNSHHRYKVWRIAADLISRYTSDDEASESLVVTLASNFAADDFEGIREYLQATTLSAGLRAVIFESAKESLLT